MAAIRNRRRQYDTIITGVAIYLLKNAGPEFASFWHDGWSLYATDTRSGRCRWSDKTLTIPVWAIEEETKWSLRPGYLKWYVAHEIAHAYAGPKANHGPDFMVQLRRLCPPDSLHYELGYKPRNATASGIRMPDGSKVVRRRPGRVRLANRLNVA